MTKPQPVRGEAQAAKPSAPPKPASPFWMWVGFAALFPLTIYSGWNAEQPQNSATWSNAPRSLSNIVGSSNLN
jgi:hypothetical protein